LIYSSSVVDPASAYLHTLSLHAALPIYPCSGMGSAHLALAAVSLAFQHSADFAPTAVAPAARQNAAAKRVAGPKTKRPGIPGTRSEEHTSELQSRENLVCRLLLEKNKYG